ncbi:MAG: hypothetical protein M3081_15720 [Gemmatimonadota bacterium]|nr:hypothetical protein [Gemmatimonadota bacterium]
MLLEEPPRTPVAKRLRGEGMPIGAVFRHLSGLYFNGKLAYARAFARPPAHNEGVYILTLTDGLMTPDTLITAADLARFAKAEMGNDAGRAELTRAVLELGEAMGDACDIVFLGSVATDKYTRMLEPALRERLLFPRELISRGQLARGALLLKCVLGELELDYEPLSALRAEPRPPMAKRVRKRISARGVAH